MHPTLQQMAMSQGYAIELYFDPALENQVLKAWNVLARRQISTQLIEIESRPHITLFSSPFIEPAKLENVIKAFASKQEPLALSFSSIGSFPHDNNVLFLSPTPSVSLLQFQSQLCEAVKREGVEIGEEYRTDSWVPCCAVAQEVPKTRMAEAFCVLRDLKLPVAGYAMDIGLVEFSPVRELFSAQGLIFTALIISVKPYAPKNFEISLLQQSSFAYCELHWLPATHSWELHSVNMILIVLTKPV
ncbi:unnamed protein product [Prunus brigantina]